MTEVIQPMFFLVDLVEELPEHFILTMEVIIPEKSMVFGWRLITLD
jgi:hypothetical protein